MGLSLERPIGSPPGCRAGSQGGRSCAVGAKTGDAGLVQSSLRSFFTRQLSGLAVPGVSAATETASKAAAVAGESTKRGEKGSSMAGYGVEAGKKRHREPAILYTSAIASGLDMENLSSPFASGVGIAKETTKEVGKPSRPRSRRGRSSGHPTDSTPSSDVGVGDSRPMKRKRLNDDIESASERCASTNNVDVPDDPGSGDRRVIGSRRKRVSVGDCVGGQQQADTRLEGGGQQQESREVKVAQEAVLASQGRGPDPQQQLSNSAALRERKRDDEGVRGEEGADVSKPRTEARAGAGADVGAGAHTKAEDEDPVGASALAEAEDEGEGCAAGLTDGGKDKHSSSRVLMQCEHAAKAMLPVLASGSARESERESDDDADPAVAGSLDGNQKITGLGNRPVLLADPADMDVALIRLNRQKVGGGADEGLSFSRSAVSNKNPNVSRGGVLDDDDGDGGELGTASRLVGNGSVGGGGEVLSRDERWSSEEDEGLCEYERLRAQTIRRNRSVLEQLGLFEASAKLQLTRKLSAGNNSTNGSGGRKGGKPRKSAVVAAESPQPLRRSLRTRGISAAPGPGEGNARANGDSSSARGDNDGEEGKQEGEEEEEEMDIEYDDSSVLRYMCASRAGSAEGLKAGAANCAALRAVPSNEEAMRTHYCRGEKDDGSVGAGGALKGVVLRSQRELIDAGRRVVGFRPSGKVLGDGALSKIYCMDLWEGENSLLIAGGHLGRMAVFGVGAVRRGWGNVDHDAEEHDDGGNAGENAEGPLLSWKGSSGWASCTQFLSRQDQDESMFVLTSSNDRTIVLWDINKQQVNHKGNSAHGSSPRVVVKTDEIHTQGIFAMDEFDCKVASASKDRTLAISSVSSAKGFVKERVLSGHHSGPIRGVSFRDEKILADCGGDGTVCVLDLRAPVPCAVSIEGAHQSAANVVAWHPSMDNILMSASLDPHIYLHDIRSTAVPLFRLSGHINPSVSRCRQIYRPAFTSDGRGVVSTGEKSQFLSLYSVDTGKAISRGHLGYSASMVMMSGSNSLRRLRHRGHGEFEDRLWIAGKEIVPYSAVLKMEELAQ
ncbi:hypothetical protein CBR_g41132 [Chara braunii]|uniref:Uncharacterized protein n=1 Tax=Chara braunii TaxID=69332 RepID=A0A388LV75_CHABU|nr:hypothetical protein CBR_g41132 [Chara braunii]|eukprot:GBG86227.1 hypothetical protein CBR_g41132 [Chara braunii]